MDRNRIKALISELSSLVDAEDLGEPESVSKFADEDSGDGGSEDPTDMEPEVDTCPPGSSHGKSKSMSFASSMLKKKLKSKGY